MVKNPHDSRTGDWQLRMTVPLELGISTIDIERMIKFYTEVLGLKRVADNTVAPELSTLTRATPSGYRIVRLQTPYGERLKLVQAETSPETPKSCHYVLERHGFAYITFVIADLDRVIEHLKKHNVKLLSNGEKVEVRSGVYAIYTVDPEGNFVEFVEHADVERYRPDIYGKRREA